jgi:hypothetical protein
MPKPISPREVPIGAADIDRFAVRLHLFGQRMPACKASPQGGLRLAELDAHRLAPNLTSGCHEGRDANRPDRIVQRVQVDLATIGQRNAELEIELPALEHAPGWLRRPDFGRRHAPGMPPEARPLMEITPDLRTAGQTIALELRRLRQLPAQHGRPVFRVGQTQAQ